MPLGNLAPQFFANVYLNELDFFVKRQFKEKYYIRYVDDFFLLHESRESLERWRESIEQFLNKKIKLQLHSDKTKRIPIARGIDFVGFRNFYHHRLLRKRNIRKMNQKIEQFLNAKISKKKFQEILHRWEVYARWASTYRLRKHIKARANLSGNN